MAKSQKALSILTAVNYLNYIDRYILAAVLISIKSDLGLSDFQAGLLATSFMVPYMFTSPLFGWLGDTRSRPKILAIGAVIWSIASLMTGAAGTFLLLAASRFLLGIGESAFTVISVPYISDSYPAEQRGKKLALFSTAIPVGAALGYILGGLLTTWIGWRGAFFTVGFPGLILAFLIWKLKDPRARATAPSDFKLKKNLKELFQSKSYRLAVLGYCAYSFVVGGVAHWIPSFMVRQFDVTQMQANTVFGGLAVVCGLLGTIVGGHAGDILDKKVGHGHLRVSSYSMVLGLPFYVACLYAPNIWVFGALIAFCQFFFFISTSPINVALLGSAPSHLGTSAIAIAIFACHILGDAISAPLIGWVSDQTHSLQLGMLACAPVVLVSAGFWYLAFKGKKVLRLSN